MTFNNWIDSPARGVDNVAGLVDGLSGSLVKNFTTAPDSSLLSTAGPVMASGVLRVFGGLFSTVSGAGVPLGFAGGMTTIMTGVTTIMNDKKAVELEPEFNDFVDVTEYVVHAPEFLQRSLEDYARWVLVEVPKSDPDNNVHYGDNGIALPGLLADRKFAKPVTEDVLPKSIYISLFSAAITNPGAKSM